MISIHPIEIIWMEAASEAMILTLEGVKSFIIRPTDDSLTLRDVQCQE